MVTTYARTGQYKGVTYSIQTKKNNMVTAVIANHKETFITWQAAERWVQETLKQPGVVL